MCCGCSYFLHGSQPQMAAGSLRPPRLSLSLEARPKGVLPRVPKDGLPTVTVLGQGQGPGAPEPWTWERDLSQLLASSGLPRDTLLSHLTSPYTSGWDGPFSPLQAPVTHLLTSAEQIPGAGVGRYWGPPSSPVWATWAAVPGVSTSTEGQALSLTLPWPSHQVRGVDLD